MEASAIQVGPGLTRPRISLGTPLLRLRSDQQLVALFREGNEDAFRVIHDRYRPRLLAYVRQMLPGRPADAEDALQDVFVRTYTGLRTSERELVLRPWLYRVAHNRCIDELRRPLPVLELLDAHERPADCDPAAETEQREALRRLVVDIGRLPEQQRSALLMRELSGMAYSDVADALDVSVPAVKSLLLRARLGLVQAVEARDTACSQIRQELAEAHDQGVRPSWMARRHLRDCAGCRAWRAEMRVSSRQVAALVPTLGPFALLAKLLGFGTGASGGTATAAGAGGATAAGAGGTAAAASGLATVTVGHVATILAAAVVTAGGAVAVQTVASQSSPYVNHVTHQAAPAATAAARAHMRPRAVIPPELRAAPANASPPRHAVQAGSAATASTARRWSPFVRPSIHSPSDVAATVSARPADTTSSCTPPPPAACTASQTTTCSTSPTSTTSSGATEKPGGTTSANATGSGTTNSSTTGSSTGASTGTTSGSTADPAGGTASGTTSATTSEAAAGACSTPTQSTTTPTTGSTTQNGAGQGGAGQTGTGQSSTTQPAKPT